MLHKKHHFDTQPFPKHHHLCGIPVLLCKYCLKIGRFSEEICFLPLAGYQPLLQQYESLKSGKLKQPPKAIFLLTVN